ncbi:MAG: hypothetical protein RR578_01915 [Bacilli bacterium]
MATLYKFLYQHRLDFLTLFVFVAASFSFRQFTFMLINQVVQGFQYIYQMTPYLLAYLVPGIYGICYIIHTYFKRLSKPCFIACEILITLLLVVSLVIFSLNFDTYMASFIHHPVNLFFPFDVLAIIIVGFTINISLMLKVFFDKGNKIDQESQMFELLESFPRIKLNVFQIIGFSLYFFITCFFTTNFFYGLTAGKNIFIDGYGYLLILFFNLIPVVNLVAYFFNEKKNNFWLKGSIALVNLVFILSFLIYELINPDFIVHIGKVFFPLDFAASIPAGPVILILSSLVPIVYFLTSFILSKIKKKEPNKTK